MNTLWHIDNDRLVGRTIASNNSVKIENDDLFITGEDQSAQMGVTIGPILDNIRIIYDRTTQTMKIFKQYPVQLIAEFGINLPIASKIRIYPDPSEMVEISNRTLINAPISNPLLDNTNLFSRSEVENIFHIWANATNLPFPISIPNTPRIYMTRSEAITPGGAMIKLSNGGASLDLIHCRGALSSQIRLMLADPPITATENVLPDYTPSIASEVALITIDPAEYTTLGVHIQDDYNDVMCSANVANTGLVGSVVLTATWSGQTGNLDGGVSAAGILTIQRSGMYCITFNLGIDVSGAIPGTFLGLRTIINGVTLEQQTQFHAVTTFNPVIVHSVTRFLGTGQLLEFGVLSDWTTYNVIGRVDISRIL